MKYIIRRIKFIKSYSVSFFTNFLRLQGLQSQKGERIDSPIELRRGRLGRRGGGGGERDRRHQGGGGGNEGRGEGAEQTGVVGHLWPRSVGGEAGQELLEGRLEDRRQQVAPGEARQSGQGGKSWRGKERGDGGQSGLGGSEGGGEGGGGEEGTHRTHRGLERPPACGRHQAEGRVGAA